ncbi:MAG TPA: RDD family protein [Terriglobia bacterium]|nr:RDD family protein [Terriglobia bacterium]
MTCPECGFVSFPDVERCKQCGYEFDGAKNAAEAALPSRAIGEVLLSDLHSAPLMEKLSSAGGDRPWGDDISEGLASSRRRRAGIRGRFDSRSNMKFEFDHELRGGVRALAEQELETSPSENRKVELVFAAEHPSSLGYVDPEVISLEDPTPPRHLRPRHTIDLEQPVDPAAALQPPLPAVQQAIRHEPVFRPVGSDLEAGGDLPVASAGQRLLAGIADGAIILLCLGVFAGIFFVSGGHLHPIPANVVILGLVASMLVFGYFGTFSAVTHATPGGQWRGISIRNLEGEIPTTGQSLLRAFGYLVAAAAFMIGFLWIVMDSGGMGWHDHMSGTMPLALGKNSQ